MNINPLTVGFLRLITLVLLYFIVIHISHLIYNISYSDWSGLLMSVIALTFLSVAAVVFWFYPVQFANLLFKDTESSGVTSIDAVELVHAGVVLMGLIIFTLAFIELAKWFIYYGLLKSPPEFDKGQLFKVSLFNILAELLMSVLILTKGYWLTDFLSKKKFEN